MNRFVGNRPAPSGRATSPGSSLTARKRSLLFLEIAVSILAVVFLFPGLLTLLNSFKTDSQIAYNPVSLPTSFNFRNYIDAWKETRFPVVFMNTLIITVFSTAGIILVSSMAAYILVRMKWKISWLLLLLFTFSMVVPFQAITKLLRKKFKRMPSGYLKKIKSQDLSTLERITENIFDIEKPEDLDRYLS